MGHMSEANALPESRVTSLQDHVPTLASIHKFSADLTFSKTVAAIFANRRGPAQHEYICTERACRVG